MSIIFHSVLWRESTGPVKNVCITPCLTLYWLPFITGHYQIYAQFRTTQQQLHAQDTTTLHPNVFLTGIHWLLFITANRINSTCVTTANFIAVVLHKHHRAYIFKMEVVFPVFLPQRHRQ